MSAPDSPDTTLTIVAAAALIRDDGQILVQRRPPESQHGSLWEFPGGKREPGETLTGCLARELAEELGISADPASFSHCASALVPHCAGELLLVLFIARRWDGEPMAQGGAQIAWVAADALSTLAMPPADGPLAVALAAQRGG